MRILLIVITITLSACSNRIDSPSSRKFVPGHIDEVYAIYKDIELGDGIDKSEATKIFHKFIQTFGVTIDRHYGEIQDLDSEWFMPVVSDWTNEETNQGIKLNKKSGIITNKKGNVIKTHDDI